MTMLAAQPVAAQLARQIEADIRQRGLRAGDAYLTANEVGELFAVHPRKAGRAMEVLAERGVLVRRPGAGTFIGQRAPKPKKATRMTVRIVTYSGKLIYGRQVGRLLAVLREYYPRHDFQIHPLEPPDELEQLKGVLHSARRHGDTAGIIAWGGTKAMQLLLAAEGVPVVSMGTVAPDVTGMPSVASDQKQAGRLMAQYMIERGHRRIVLLMRDQWGTGDNHFCDGIDETVATHPGVVRLLRSLPADAREVRDHLDTLTSGDDPVTAAICRNGFFAACAGACDGVDVIYDAIDAEDREVPDVPFVCLRGGFEAAARTAVAMLRDMMDEKPLKTLADIIPVELVRINQGACNDSSGA